VDVIALWTPCVVVSSDLVTLKQKIILELRGGKKYGKSIHIEKPNKWSQKSVVYTLSLREKPVDKISSDSIQAT
jgi:hypothetical protein